MQRVNADSRSGGKYYTRLFHPLVPILRAVENADYNDCVVRFIRFVHDDVKGASHNPLTRSGRFTDTANMREFAQTFSRHPNIGGDPPRR